MGLLVASTTQCDLTRIYVMDPNPLAPKDVTPRILKARGVTVHRLLVGYHRNLHSGVLSPTYLWRVLEGTKPYGTHKKLRFAVQWALDNL